MDWVDKEDAYGPVGEVGHAGGFELHLCLLAWVLA